MPALKPERKQPKVLLAASVNQFTLPWSNMQLVNKTGRPYALICQHAKGGRQGVGEHVKCDILCGKKHFLVILVLVTSEEKTF
jgi:hypothetical protein